MHNLFQKWAYRDNSSSFHTSWPENYCMALILQHYWQDLNTCPKVVGARGTKTAAKCVSLGQDGSRDAYRLSRWEVDCDFHHFPQGRRWSHDWAKAYDYWPPLTSTRKVRASKHLCLQLVTTFTSPLARVQNEIQSHATFCVSLTFHNVISCVFRQQVAS